MKHFAYPNTSDPGRTDWIQYVMPPKERGGAPRLYRLNMSWLMSNWHCTFGSCPGILVSGALNDVSCCQIGVEFGQHEGPKEKWAEFHHIKSMVRELTPEDWDHGYGKDKPDGYWATFNRTAVKKTKHKGSGKGSQLVPKQTKVVDGGCVFANRSDGAAGKPGCAFHILAERTGRHHSETKPEICWTVPYFVQETYDDEIQMDVYTVTSLFASTWGPYDTEYTETVGHWCTEIPDHYSGSQLVYQYGEVELRKIMGDAEYERMVQEIEKAKKRFSPIQPMPGQLVNHGRRTLPLLVLNRQRQWAVEGSTDKAATAEKWLNEYARRDKEES